MLGVPFDNITVAETIARIEQMIASRQPHYLVTANVDFLVQARADIELHRILADAHLVLCDGTPLVWASRVLGNPLPERVAGADLVPLLIRVAAAKGYRLFLLGASPESASAAVARLQEQYPSLIIAGHYSPPLAPLLDMDHEQIRRRIIKAKPDILLVAFGCPKQEKWMWMHHRSLGIPVCAGVGGTIDFLAGRLKRAPRWVQLSGTEWIFRLLQEPSRLFRRYTKDLWIFGRAILPEIWHLRVRRARSTPPSSPAAAPVDANAKAQFEGDGFYLASAPAELDAATMYRDGDWFTHMLASGLDCVLQLAEVKFIDSTGMGVLIKAQKRLRDSGRHLVLLAPSSIVQRSLSLMRLESFFMIAPDLSAAWRALEEKKNVQVGCHVAPGPGCVQWAGELTAGNLESLWLQTSAWLSGLPEKSAAVIDLSQVRFIDSSGLGLLIRLRKLASQQQRSLRFITLPPVVLNVIRIAQLEKFLLGDEAAPPLR